MSLAVAGSLAGAGSASAEDHVGCIHCESSPRVAALHSVLIKLDELMFKFGEGAFIKLDTALFKINVVLLKFTTD